MLKAWTKSAKPQCLCGFPTLSYYNALVDTSDNSSCFHILCLRLLQNHFSGSICKRWKDMHKSFSEPENQVCLYF